MLEIEVFCLDKVTMKLVLNIVIVFGVYFCCIFGQRRRLPSDLQKRTDYDSNGKIIYFPKAIKATTVQRNEFSSFVSIQTEYGQHICGGMLLDIDFVITTASCLLKKNSRNEYYKPEEVGVN